MKISEGMNTDIVKFKIHAEGQLAFVGISINCILSFYFKNDSKLVLFLISVKCLIILTMNAFHCHEKGLLLWLLEFIWIFAIDSIKITAFL